MGAVGVSLLEAWASTFPSSQLNLLGVGLSPDMYTARKLHSCSIRHQRLNLQLTLAFFPFYSQTGIISLYDCVFKRRLDYNQKLHRDDREHAKALGLHVNEEVTLSRILTSCK